MNHQLRLKQLSIIKLHIQAQKFMWVEYLQL